jgi:cold shock protein
MKRRSFLVTTGLQESGDDAFFHFTALPGQGYRTIRPGTYVQFEVVETRTGPTDRNIQQIKERTL